MKEVDNNLWYQNIDFVELLRTIRVCHKRFETTPDLHQVYARCRAEARRIRDKVYKQKVNKQQYGCVTPSLNQHMLRRRCIFQIQNFGNYKVGVATGSQHPIIVKSGVTSIGNTLIGSNKAQSGF